MEIEAAETEMRAKVETARVAMDTPRIVSIAVYSLVELWKLDPAAALAIADASRLSAELKATLND